MFEWQDHGPILDDCLWVIPDFLKRAEDRKPEVLETLSGEPPDS
jgi:hypothetical protein